MAIIYEVIFKNKNNKGNHSRSFYFSDKEQANLFAEDTCDEYIKYGLKEISKRKTVLDNEGMIHAKSIFVNSDGEDQSISVDVVSHTLYPNEIKDSVRDAMYHIIVNSVIKGN